MLIALTRHVSPAVAACELTHLDRAPIDVVLAQAQHAAYVEALQQLGCRVLELPAQASQPDSVFVEDVAVVLDEVAVMTRPGAASRRSEVESVASALVPLRTIRRLEAPATLDGGDVLRLGHELWVGCSGRSNAEGIGQLAQQVGEFGYRVRALPISGCLHLKSAVTQLDAETLLVQPQWIDPRLLRGWRLIEVDPAEPHAANILRIGDTGWIYPACFPRTTALLQRAGFEPTLVDVSELQKAEGAVTCCSLIFADPR